MLTGRRGIATTKLGILNTGAGIDTLFRRCLPGGAVLPPESLHEATQALCYTGPVEESVKNLTLAIEDEVLESARRLALEQGTTLNQLVRDHLADLVARQGR